jgi:DNA-binding transcriptional LysR family regulator
MRHRQAVGEPRRLGQIAPERVVVLPCEPNRGFYDAVVASCREAGLAPTFVEMPDAHLERALLAVAAGAGLALLPESVADRYVAPACASCHWRTINRLWRVSACRRTARPGLTDPRERTSVSCACA